MNAIEIPELLLSIANYLERRHVVVCLKVCRSWNELLQPLIWRSVTVGNVSRKMNKPSRDNLERHGHYVFDLTIICPYPLEHYTLAFPRLHTLVLTDRNGCYRQSQLDITQLITFNPSLVYLSIGIYRMEMGEQFWKAASCLPRLKKLEMDRVKLSSGVMKMFWDVCSKLQDVSLVEVQFPGNEIQLAEWSFSQMRKLMFDYNLGVSPSAELEIILRCTNLQDLEWITRSGNNIHEFVNSIKQGSLPRLERLRIRDDKRRESRINAITDKVCECIIDSMQQITKLSLSESGFGHLSFRALRRHFNAVVDLDLRFSPGATSSMLQELLCSCPLLEKLKGKSIQAKDVVEGKEWVCLSMKELEVSFRFGESEQGLQPLVFKRLSSLVLIEKFSIRDFYIDGIGVCRLDMRLVKGLGQLSRWKNIKSLCVGDSKQSMEEADFQWMMANWPRLDAFYGQLNKDEEIEQHLQEILKARGIKTW